MTTRLSGKMLFQVRIEEGGTEIGVLLIAFAPLDLAFTEAPRAFEPAMSLLTLGVLAFGAALFAELRRGDRG